MRSSSARIAANAADPVQAVVGIARLAVMTGASPRALRYYEEIGLLHPLRTPNRGRLFTGQQCEIARLVVLLRGLDVPVPEIRLLLEAEEGDFSHSRGLRAALEKRASDLSLRLSAVQTALAGLGKDHGGGQTARRAA